MRHSFRVFVISSALVVQAGAQEPPTSATFYPLGILPGGQFSQPFSISRDGSTVVGSSPANLATSRAFSWRINSGMSELPAHPDFINPSALCVNSDGSIVGGMAQIAANPNYGKAARWVNGVPVSLTDPGITHSSAWGMNGDGSMMTGVQGATATRWTQAGGFQDLGTLPGQSGSRGFGMSVDGSVIVGETESDAFRWTAGGMVALPRAGGSPYARANAVSGDGLVAVGESGSRATRWVGLNLPQLLAFPGGSWAQAYGVDYDGDSVVGTGTLASGASAAFLWTAELGLQDLNTYLPTLGVNLSGWQLYEARAISSDGLTIVGTGYHTIPGIGFRQEAWVVMIPAPSTLVALSLVAGVVMPRRRRTPLPLAPCSPRSTAS